MADMQQQPEINVTVNGRPRQLPAGATVSTLLTQCGFPPTGIAVAVNRTVIPRSRHLEHTLQDGDQVDAVQAVGGG
ncbi:MAG: sulfur carrier protein ThiS [Aquisalimonadaceae bacterium]